MKMRYALAILAYVVPTFAVAYTWHLVLFKEYYAALQIYRADIIVPFGFLSILIQAVVFAWFYDKAFADQGGTWLSRGFIYAVIGGILSWSFTTLAVAAKNLMASVPDYLLIETAYTIVQWIIVGPLTALALERGKVVRSHQAGA
jgi:hypothetical protein